MSKEIFIVRHGKTAFNLAGKLQGQGVDSPLQTTGNEFDAVANYLSQFAFATVATSQLPRAITTASEIVRRWPRQPHTMPQLAAFNEVSFGQWEGKQRQELEKTAPADFALLKQRHFAPSLAAHGIEDFTAAGQRFASGVRELLGELDEGERALVVSHGAVSHLGIQQLVGTTALRGLGNLSTTVLVEDAGQFKIKHYNETGYLPQGNVLPNTSL